MDKAQLAAGATLSLSNPIINTAASVIGSAKTGTAISTLHGAAHASATAAWIGFGSMHFGMFMMGALPVVGVLLLLDGICGRDYGVPLIDWYEEFWKRYEVEHELQQMKQQIKSDKDHQLRATKTAASMSQLDHQFRSLEVEHELHLLKKKLGLN